MKPRAVHDRPNAPASSRPSRWNCHGNLYATCGPGRPQPRQGCPTPRPRNPASGRSCAVPELPSLRLLSVSIPRRVVLVGPCPVERAVLQRAGLALHARQGGVEPGDVREAVEARLGGNHLAGAAERLHGDDAALGALPRRLHREVADVGAHVHHDGVRCDRHVPVAEVGVRERQLVDDGQIERAAADGVARPVAKLQDRVDAQLRQEHRPPVPVDARTSEKVVKAVPPSRDRHGGAPSPGFNGVRHDLVRAIPAVRHEQKSTTPAGSPRPSLAARLRSTCRVFRIPGMTVDTSRVGQDETKRQLRQIHARRNGGLQSIHARERVRQVLRREVHVPPVAVRPRAVRGERAGEAAFVERDAR